MIVYDRWKIEYSEPLLPSSLKQAGFPTLLSLLLCQKGFDTAEKARDFLDSSFDSFEDPFLFKDMRAAVNRIRSAIIAKESVAVFGDYDVDGITATCLMTDCLARCGLSVVPYIPDRINEGYGLNREAVLKLYNQGVSLIVTVDCGITAEDEVTYAKSLGMDVIITDHHECQSQLPSCAAAIIDPKREDCSYPNKDLAGVGVALKLACALSTDYKKVLSLYSEWVAIGTIADVMELSPENRLLVKTGIEKISSSPSVGIAALLDKSGIGEKKISSTTIGFSIAPRINAAGRLGHAAIAYELLRCSDPEKANQLAEELCDLNRKRQQLETEIWEDATRLLTDFPAGNPIVLESPSWHPGVVGIAASRLAEQFSVPAIMICLKDGIGKGSCRSYGSFNIFEALSACSKYLISFGGHAQAAGLTVQEQQLPAFKTALTEYYNHHLPEEGAVLSCDLLITDPSLLTKENVQALDLLEPFGNGNPTPVFCISGAELCDVHPIGAGKHLRFRIKYNEKLLDCVYFSCTENQFGLHSGDLVDVAFHAKINEFNGTSSVQLQILSAKPHSPTELCEKLISDPSSVLWCCGDYCPSRADFISAWKNIKSITGSLGGDLPALLQHCPGDLPEEKYILTLLVWNELGLIESSQSDSVLNTAINRNRKVDLEESDLLSKLKSLNKERGADNV